MSDKTPHPNSLANLTPFNTEKARKAQLKSAASRKANRMAREAMQMSMNEWKTYKPLLDEADLSAVDVLKILMHKSMMDDDMDTAVDIAKSVAEFEQPKLARIDQTVEQTSTSDLSDDELNEKLKNLLDGKS